MKKAIVYLLIPLLIVSFLGFYHLNLYVMQPGSAHDVSKLIEVSEGDQDDKGTLSLMTVAMYQATPISYLFSKFKEHRKFLNIEQVRNPHENEEEYNVRQLQLMQDSQFNAKLVAFKQAGLSYNVQHHGIYVLNVLEGGASDRILKTGDEIVAINGEVVKDQQQLASKLVNKRINEKMELAIIRNKKKLDVAINLNRIPGATNSKMGLGITYAESKSITTDPKVTISTEDIGGPSAGLMFTLGMLNQLLDEDLTKGYNIAGTGEMHEDGTVGRIGGIDMKVVAADEDGMEIFFAPEDEITKEMKKNNPEIVSNYETAVRTAKEIGTDMKIVPVKTIEDALAYLDKMEPK